MNVTIMAKEFVAQHKINNDNLNYDLLERIIIDLGFTIINFDPNNTLETEKLFSKLNLDKYTKQQKCFIYSCSGIQYIFIVKTLTTNEKIPLLLHEIGHIVLKHPIECSIISTRSPEYETEANDFSCKVREFAENSSKTDKALKLSFVGVLLTALVAVITLTMVVILRMPDKSDYFVIDTYSASSSSLLESSTTDEDDTSSQETESKPETTATTTAKPKKSKTTTTTTTTTTTPSTTIPPETAQPYENGVEEVYYVTKSGTKYHTADCYYVSNRATIALPLSELEELGYTPCSHCIR